MKGLSIRPGVAALLTGAFTFAVYAFTVAPGLGFIDSGELSTVACRLGIAHPTGYPLFTLLGWAFTHLPVPAGGVARLNVMAALFCSAAAGIFLLVFRRAVLLSAGRQSGGAFATESAAGGALILAFSATYWSQAVAVEVYPLHLLFVSALMLLFLRAAFPLPGEGTGRRDWYLFAYAVGLAFTNHMTTIFLAPGLLTMYFARQGGSRASWTLLARMAPPFLAGLSLYAYIPLRASQSPVLNWGYAVTPERLFWHLSGKQYQVWMFSSMDVVVNQISYFLGTLAGDFTVAGLLLCAAGAFALWRGNRRLAAGVAILFLFCVFYAANYNIHDIDSYFLLAYICMALAAAVGLSALVSLAAGRFARPDAVISALILVVSLIPLVVNFRDADESGDHLVEDYTANMFSSLRPGAVIISYQWDYWVSASYYDQLVVGVRPDVTVIDKELLRRSWYIRELETRRPWLIEDSRAEVNAFLAQVDLFEHGLPYDPARIQASYVAMIGSFIRRSLPAHPVYVTEEIEPEFTRGLFRVPEGLAFRLAAGEGEVPPPLPDFTYRPFARRGRLEDMIRKLYADACISRGEYFLLMLHDPGEASKCLEKAGMFDSPSPRARRLAGLLPH